LWLGRRARQRAGADDPPAGAPTTKKLGPEEIAKLKELKELLDNDALSQAEFDAQTETSG